MMQNLDEKEWQAFEIQDMFTINSGVRLESRNRTSGSRPFIGALDNSNGVVEFVSNMNASLDSNVLGVNYNGNGMGIGFYHPYECIFSDDVKRFHWKNTDDKKELALFAKTMIEKQRGKFGYLYKFNTKRMAATSIELPVQDDKQPDFTYMQEYIEKVIECKKQQYLEYLKVCINTIGSVIEIPSLQEKEWRAFSIGSLFDIKPTKGETTGQLVVGNDVPYIAAKNNNNGFAGMFDSTQYPEWVSKGNGIVFVQLGDGAAGLAYYVSMDFIGMNGKTSVGYNVNLNKYNGIFIARVLSANKDIFSHGHSWTGKRLKNTKFRLPVDDTGEPDYAYMEQYSKNMMLRKYQQYLDYLNKN